MITKELWAKAGTVTMIGPEGPVEIPIWGFSDSAGGPPQLPGPLIEATEGDDVQVILHNTLAEPVCIIFPGQDRVPHPVKDGNGRFTSYDTPAEPNGGTAVYSFTAARPGTYLYESGSHPEKQVPMGLYGAMIIRPADYNPGEPSGKTAYGAGTGSEFDVEQVIVLAEMDSRLHHQIAAGLPFDSSGYSPDYWIINGRSFPATVVPAAGTSQPYGAKVNAEVGQRVLLRCLNAGCQNHSLHLSGSLFRVVAGDARPLKTAGLDATYQRHTLTVGSGQTYDLIFTAGSPGQYYLFDRELHHLAQRGRSPGGMMTRIDVFPAIPTTPPAPPTGVTCEAVSPSMVELAWTDPGDGKDGHVVERKTGVDGDYAIIAVLLGPWVTGYVDRAVSANTTYLYRVRAFNAAGFSLYSNETVTTTPDIPPSAPASLVARAVSQTHVRLTWLDTSTNETGFRVERKPGVNGAYSTIGEVGAGATAYDDFTVAARSTYYYRVQAYNAAGGSPYSNEAVALTPDNPPLAPSNLEARAVSAQQVELIWTDNSDNEDGFWIERKAGAEEPYLRIARLAANVTNYTDTSVTPNTSYRYRVQAYNQSGPSGYSNEAAVITPDAPPAAPSNLVAEGRFGKRIRLRWNDNSHNEEGFVIERKKWWDTRFVEVAVVRANTTEYIDRNLDPTIQYHYRVKAFNAGGFSLYSNIAMAWPYW